MTAIIENSPGVNNSQIPWWRGNARLKNLSGRLLKAYVVRTSIIVFLAVVRSSIDPDVPNELKTKGGWNQFAIAFLVGGLGGAFFAFQIYDHLDVLKSILSGSI